MGLKGKNVLITGGEGFIGSHLVQKLIGPKTQIVVPVEHIDPKSFFVAQCLDKKVTIANANCKSFKEIFNVITKHEIDFIFHLAAQSIVTSALANPVETFESNVMGTVNVLEAARLWGRVEGIVVVSSDKAYGKIPRASETDPISGDHPYESSKAACDLIATTYFKTYKLPVVVARFGNTYGEGDVNFSRLIPGIMKAIATESIFEIRSDGKYVRDYVYVEDIVGALISLAQNVKKVKGEAFNASSKENLSVMGVIDKVARALDIKIRYKIKRSAKNEIPVQSINFTKITKTLGWKPKYKMDERIPGIFDWYKNYFAT